MLNSFAVREGELRVQTVPHVFPSYTAAERRLDYIVHILGITAAPAACLWLLGHASGTAVTLSLAVYCIGLITMLGFSALYNMLPQTPWKEWARRFDHAAIYVMIAGTCTPLTVNRVPGAEGLGIGVFMWLAAGVGIVLALVFPHNFLRLKIALYLIIGWSMIAVIGPLSEAVRVSTLVLLLVGGAVYSLGVAFHLLERLRFHNAIWHALVLLAASLHFVALANELVS